MSTTNLIIGIAVVLFVIVLAIAWYRNYRNAFAVVLVLGVVAAAITVTVYSIQQYDAQKAHAQSEAATIQANPGYGSSTPPEPPARIVPPPSVPLGGATGAAAPPAARNPNLGAGK